MQLYRVLDPNTWGKMVGRVNGVNFTGMYGGTHAMGWQSVKLPEGYTWRELCIFVVYSAGAGEEELSTETFSEREFLADKRRMPE